MSRTTTLFMVLAFLPSLNQAIAQCPSINASIQAPDHVCQFETFFLNITIDGDAPPFTTTFSLNGSETTTVINGSSEAIPIFISSSTNYFLVSVIDANGCPADLFGGGIIEVNPSPTPVIVGDFLICDGGGTYLEVNSGYASYHWDTGQNSSGIFINQPGTYSVTVTDTQGCIGTSSADILLGPNPFVEIQGPEYICPGEIAVLIATGGYAAYSWSDGSTAQSATISIPGIYEVTVSDQNGCTGFASIEVLPKPPVNNACGSAETLNLRGGSCNTAAGNYFTFSNVGQSDSIAIPPLVGCQGDWELNQSAASLWYTFFSPNDFVEIAIAGLDKPNLVLYVGDDCNSLLPIACASALPNQNSTFLSTNVQVGQQYYLQIAGENTDDQGEFEFTITNFSTCPDECKVKSFLTTDPPPVNGQYAQGQEVEFCFHIPGLVLPNVEWLHAVEVNFGSAWNLGTFNPYPSVTCGGTPGYWDWYDYWISCVTGESFGPGFAFDDPQSSCGGTLDGNPGNSWGDGTNGCSQQPDGLPFMFCWTISVNDCIPDAAALDLNIYIDVLSDGLSGGWNGNGFFGCEVPFNYFFSVDTEAPSAFVELGPDFNLCIGDSRTINAHIDGCPDCTYIWNTGQNTPTITVAEEGTYSVTVTHPDGCESVDEIVATLQTTTTTEIHETICEGEFYYLGPSVFSQSGFYTVPLVGSNGCDSIILLNLTVIPTFYSFVNAEICEGESYQLGTNTYTLSGDYTEIFTSTLGCDSIIVLFLNVFPPSIDTIQASICEGENYLLFGIPYTMTGTYTDTLMGGTTTGCDSIVTLELSVLPNGIDSIAFDICPGDSFTFLGNTYTVSGEDIIVIPNGATNGCDSIIVVDITVLPYPTLVIDTTIIEGEVLTINGMDYDSTGFYTIILPEVAVNGCDSLINLTLNVVPPNCDPNVINLETEIVVLQEISCYGLADGIIELTATENGFPITDFSGYDIQWSNGVSNNAVNANLSAGIYTVTLTNPIGCTVSDAISLTQPDLIETEISVSLCEGESIIIGGNVYDMAGTFTEILSSSNGCDSTLIIIIEVLPLPVVDITATSTSICSGETAILSASGGFVYDWNIGATTPEITVAPSTTTTYTVTVTDVNGCSNTADITIEVDTPLAPLDMVCTTNGTGEISFEWNEIDGVDAYEVTYFNQTQVINLTNFTITGLFPDEEVTLEVLPIYDGPCPVASSALTCISGSCPDIIFDIPVPDPICETDPPFPLVVNFVNGSGTGEYIWQGDGVLSGTNTFDPLIAGVGNHIIGLTYIEGDCEYHATVVFTVYPTPQAAFNLENKICISSYASATFQGQAGQDATYNWDFDGGNAIPGTGPGPHEITWTTTGLKTVSLVIEENGCTSEIFSRNIEVQSNLPAPNISCLGINDILAFGWQPIPGATGYDINVLTGQTGTLNGNIFTVFNLAANEEVTVEVIAFDGGGSCGDTRDTLSCIAEGDIIMLSQPQFELDEASGTIQLAPENDASGFKLSGPYPNPAKNQTRLELVLDKLYPVEITLMDVNGRKIKTIASSVITDSFHQFNIITQDLTTGVYFLSIKIGEEMQTRKIVVIQ